MTVAGRRPLLVAHRGGAGLWPENSLLAYRQALGLGVDLVECDVHLSRDDEVVVIHDPTLERTTNCRGAVIEKTLAEVKQCDAGRWFHEKFAGTRVPTLRELFERYGTSTSYYIETKNPDEAPGMEEALLALIDEFGLHDGAVQRRQVLIQSFSRASLKKIRQADARLPLIQLIEKEHDSAAISAMLPAIAEYAVGIGPSRFSVDASLVAAVHAHGLVIHPYTVDQPADMRRMIDLGVDGMFTDYPDRLRDLLTM